LKSISPPDRSRSFQKANAQLRNDRGCGEMPGTVGVDKMTMRAGTGLGEIRVSSCSVFWEP
jgi:hypothetical protein